MGVLSMLCLFALMTYTCTCKGQEHTSEHVQEVPAAEPIALRKYQVSHKNMHVQCAPCPLSVFSSMCRHISTR